MAQSLTERKPSNWRALAVYKDGRECLLLVGPNFSYVTENYDTPFYDYLEEDEREMVEKIHLQKWVGAPDNGHWQNQRQLAKPEPFSILKITTIKDVG